MRRRFAVAAQLAVSAFLASSAVASDLFGVKFDASTPLYSINESTGALISIGGTGFANVADLTSDPVTDTLWGVEVNTNELLTIDRHTGAASVAAQLDSVNPIVSLAFDPLTRTLYGSTSIGFAQPGEDVLYAIDPVTGSTTSKGSIGFEKVYALGFDQHGTLFGISDFSKELITINIATGAGTLVPGSSALEVSAAFDIASRPEDNTMFLADSGTASLYKLNTANGKLTAVGSYGSMTNIVGLGFLVPEPDTYLALAVGLGLLALLRRRLPY
jgi:hypothetical protein